MDNITHTLAGLALAEAALAFRRSRGAKTEPALVRTAWLTSALANNFPDLDLVLTPLTQAPFGYMLHHRGHTHTFLLAPLMAAAALGLALLYARREKFAPDRGQAMFLFALAWLGAMLHIGMDATNSYGVHPLWPLDDHWYAADWMFIVEPLWWVTLAVPLSFSVKRPAARWVLLGIAGLGIVSGLALGVVSSLALAWLCLLFAALYGWSSRLSSGGGRAALSVVSSVLVLLAFATGRATAETRVLTVVNGAFPHSIEADLILSPEPGNPLCWQAITVSEERADLVLRRIRVSAASGLHPVALCRMAFSETTSAERTPIERSEMRDIRFVDEVRTSLTRLRELDADDCRAAAFLRFARAPFVTERADGLLMGDLRYDREEGPGFAGALLVGEPSECPQRVPPWIPWRAEVLSGPLPEEIHRFEDLDF